MSVQLLAGPIVRRVEPGLASVWVALNEACTVRLELWSGRPDPDLSRGEPVASNTARTLRVGRNLHIVVVHVQPDQALRSVENYSYNLTFTPVSGAGPAVDLGDLGLLRDSPQGARPHLALGHDPDYLPSFALPPPSLTDLVIVHGSCRKTEGAHEDALAYLDRMIFDTRDSAARRPHQLFLTGDQIYADEVATWLLTKLNQDGKERFGIDEEVRLFQAGHENDPLPNETNTQIVPVTMDRLPAGRRQSIVDLHARFTGNGTPSHLISFAEFCAMYLFTLSNALWPQGDASTFDTLADLPSIKRVAFEDSNPIAPQLSATEGEWEDHYTAHDESLRGLLHGLPHVRRALANVPVYMIFDDHEVADDWNLNKSWEEQVYTSPLGSTIVRNALLAYTLFQGWGNDPLGFAEGGDTNKRKLLCCIRRLFPEDTSSAADSQDPFVDSALSPETVRQTMDDLLGLAGGPPRIKWHYRVTGPEYEVLVLDTRTARFYPSRYEMAGLLTDAALNEQIPMEEAAATVKVIFVVAPLPVFGPSIYDEIIRPGTATLRNWVLVEKTSRLERQGGRLSDPEGWPFEPYTLEKFLARLAVRSRREEERRPILLLSGDIHFALTVEMDYFTSATEPGIRFVQLISSPLKNPEDDKLISVVTTGGAQIFMTNPLAPTRVAWRDQFPSPVIMAEGERIPSVYLPRLRRSPVLVAPHGWPPGARMARPPDWAWQARIVRDERREEHEPPEHGELRTTHEDFYAQVFEPDIDTVNKTEDGILDDYLRVITRQTDAIDRVAPRRVVFESNIGVVKFVLREAGLTVRHELHYRPRRLLHGDVPEQPYTVCEVALSVPAETRCPGIGEDAEP